MKFIYLLFSGLLRRSHAVVLAVILASHGAVATEPLKLIGFLKHSTDPEFPREYAGAHCSVDGSSLCYLIILDTFRPFDRHGLTGEISDGQFVLTFPLRMTFANRGRTAPFEPPHGPNSFPDTLYYADEIALPKWAQTAVATQSLRVRVFDSRNEWEAVVKETDAFFFQDPRAFKAAHDPAPLADPFVTVAVFEGFAVQREVVASGKQVRMAVRSFLVLGQSAADKQASTDGEMRFTGRWVETERDGRVRAANTAKSWTFSTVDGELFARSESGETSFIAHGVLGKSAAGGQGFALPKILSTTVQRVAPGAATMEKRAVQFSLNLKFNHALTAAALGAGEEIDATVLRIAP